MRVRLSGWHRLGIVASLLLWLACVGAEYRVETSDGPFGRGWLTETIVTKTGEPASVLKDNRFGDLVPIDQVAHLNRVLLVSLVPIGAIWIFGFLSWVRSGFRCDSGQ
jgi:hypothetical protein